MENLMILAYVYINFQKVAPWVIGLIVFLWIRHKINRLKKRNTKPKSDKNGN